MRNRTGRELAQSVIAVEDSVQNGIAAMEKGVDSVRLVSSNVEDADGQEMDWWTGLLGEMMIQVVEQR